MTSIPFESLLEWVLPRFSSTELELQDSFLKKISAVKVFKDQNLLAVVDIPKDGSSLAEDSIYLKAVVNAYLPKFAAEVFPIAEAITLVKDWVSSEGGKLNSEVKLESGILRFDALFPIISLPEKMAEDAAPEEESKEEPKEEAPEETPEVKETPEEPAKETPEEPAKEAAPPAKEEEK